MNLYSCEFTFGEEIIIDGDSELKAIVTAIIFKPDYKEDFTEGMTDAFKRALDAAIGQKMSSKFPARRIEAIQSTGNDREREYARHIENQKNRIAELESLLNIEEHRTRNQALHIDRLNRELRDLKKGKLDDMHV